MQVARSNCKGKGYFDVQKTIWRDKHFFAVVLSQTDLGMVDIKLNLIYTTCYQTIPSILNKMDEL